MRCILFAILSSAILAPCLHGGQLTAWGAAQQPVPNLANAKQISAALDHSVVLNADGTVTCFGYNFNYQSTVPSGLSSVRDVAAGPAFSLAARSNGTVVAWGDNTFGQCDVPFWLSGAVSLSAGQKHAIALRNDGSVVAWGDNDYGQTNVPPDLGVVTAVRASHNFTLALRPNGTVTGWGDNSAGQTTIPPGLSNVTAIDANITYCLALKADGTVVAWGKGPGLPNGGLSQVVAIAAGENHALAAKSDGSVVAWGFNEGGQLEVPGTLANAGSVAAAWHFSAAISRDQSAAFLAMNPSYSAGVFTVSVATQQGFSYSLEYKDSLSDPSWQPVQTVAGTGAAVLLSDPNANSVRRSYRIARTP